MTKKMSNETQLFIRACKRPNSAKRCESILRRFFLFGNYVTNENEQKVYDNDIMNATIIQLTEIVDQYCPMTSIDIIKELTSDRSFFKDERSTKERARDMLISRISNTEKKKFEGLKTPCWVNKKYKEKV